MPIKAVFMFVAPQADPEKDRNSVITPEVEVLTVAVSDYAQAAETAHALYMDGYTAIELCGGFGIEGVAKVKQAVEARIPVGVVRFDYHPGLGHKSGDSIFGS